MLEPDGFTTVNLFPAGKVIKTIKPGCFPNETPVSEKALARSSFVLEAACGGFERKRLQLREAPVLISTVDFANYSRSLAHNPSKIQHRIALILRIGLIPYDKAYSAPN